MNKSSSRRSRQQRLEIENQVLNAIDHSMQCFKNRFTLDNPRFIERYSKGETHILLEFRYIGEADERQSEFVAYFQRGTSASEGHGDSNSLNLRVTSVNGPSFLSGDSFEQSHSEERRGDKGRNVDSGSEQGAVLVYIVESMETPQDRGIPSLVRLAPFDSFYSNLRHSLYFSTRLGFVSRGVLRDREVGVFENPFIPRPVQPSELERQMIQCSPQVLNHVASDSSEKARRIGGTYDVILDSLRSLRIRLGSNFIWVGVQKGAEFNLEIREVLFGPVNFNADLGKSIIGGSRT